ncbi:MAG: DNA repair protein RadA [Rhizobiales bacterium]|nr:DNA repair protein RadA [Hyphomicrobiales bacterium]
MARAQANFVCQSCGTVYSRWSGRCESCGEWNSILEESASGAAGGPQIGKSSKGRPVKLVALDSELGEAPRSSSGIGEFDRVVGGGLVRGSAVLVGGDPGIGKSTLLLQIAGCMAKSGGNIVYISGEEAPAQVQMRARRLGLSDVGVSLGAETNVENIIATLGAEKSVQLAVIDSIQTMWTNNIDSAPGTVSQVRASSQALIRYAKRSGTAIVLVGHVTKDGQIAGPRVVEHMVDAVLYFEGDSSHQFRILRAVKNRFGPTDEIGVFEMTGDGLAEVTNPSALFLGDRESKSPGTAVFAAMEGSRPLLIEVQALVAESSLGTPRRAVVGWDSSRLAMVLAVLESRCGIRLSGHDIYLNVAGGLKLTEPAADLAAGAAIVSALTGAILPAENVYFGEISLSGAVRKVSQPDARLREAGKLGFTGAVMPTGQIKEKKENMSVSQVANLGDLVAMVAATAPAPKGGDTS